MPNRSYNETFAKSLNDGCVCLPDFMCEIDITTVCDCRWTEIAGVDKGVKFCELATLSVMYRY